MNDLYNCQQRLESAKRRLSASPYGNMLLAFLNHLKALGLSDPRVLKYAEALSTIFKHAPFNPAEASRQDIEGVVAWINAQPYKSWTKHGLKLAVKKLVQYAKYGSCEPKAPLPPEVGWIPMKVDERDNKVKPELLLTSDEIKALVAAAQNERDRALIFVLFEAALRTGELLNMSVGSVDFKHEYCVITVNGKTGVKRIPLVVSYKPLLEWLQKHPRRNDPDAPLWASMGNNAKGDRMTYYYLRKMLKKLADNAGVKKNIWPYLFRHTMLTNLAKLFTEAKLELFAGWVQGSKMSKRYVHFSMRDLEDSILQLHGLKKGTELEGILRTVDCPRCGKRNEPDTVRCSFCGFVLDRGFALKMDHEERRIDEEILARIEKLEKTIEGLLNASQRMPSSNPVPLGAT
jgi:integrase